MDSYLTKFNAVSALIKSSKHSKIISTIDGLKEHGVDYFPFSVENIKGMSGYTLPADLFGGIDVSGFHLNWHYEINKLKKGGGEFNLRDFLLVFCAENSELQSKNDPSEIGAIKHQLSVIDEHPETGDDQFAAFRLEGPDKMPPEIWYWNRGVIFKMNLTYSGYLDALLDLKGINYWHFLFVDIITNEYYGKYYDKTEYKHICDSLNEKINDLEFLFPNVDYLKYKQKLVELNKKVEMMK